MAVAKSLARLGTRIQEVLAIVTSAGADDAGKIPALDGSGRLDQSMMPVGIGADTTSTLAFENLSAGDFVYIGSDGKARKADASAAGKEAIGFVLDAVTAGQSALVYHEGSNTAVTGATVGRVYLSDSTPGGFTSAAVNGAGKVHQYLGQAVSATRIVFEADDGIVLA